MKYMGSKRVMLQNGLGTMILEESKRAKRIVDLFCGAGAVAWYAAENTKLPVMAIDLQNYSVILAKSVLCREGFCDQDELEKSWLDVVKQKRKKSVLWEKAVSLSAFPDLRKIRFQAEKCRSLCRSESRVGPIWNAYGGYYFSPVQALTMDYLLKYLPGDEPERSACHAALITAACRCAASPGHTAQPFQPTLTARKFIVESWNKDLIEACKKALKEICEKKAIKVGNAYMADAIEEAKNLKSGDLVIVDPPYSGVQYSRFYHVLETLAIGSCGPVSGVGRYPAREERPQSGFSNSGQSKEALTNLLSNLSKAGTTVIFTFPEGECSNGLSGNIIHEEAARFFSIKKKIVKGKFSTLGGNNKKNKRRSRKDSSELILLMRPK